MTNSDRLREPTERLRDRRPWKTLMPALAGLLLLPSACQEAPRPAPPPAESGGATAAAATASAPTPAAQSVEVSPRILRRFSPLRGADAGGPPPSAALVDLGRMLYFDARLSASKDVSCNSCHPLDRYGATEESVSRGVHGRTGTRNAPSTYNAARHFSQFWDGRSESVEDQAVAPILEPLEMGMSSAAEVVARLKMIEGYRAQFAKAFPDETEPLTYRNVGVAIGAFERGLVTPAPWDRYLLGDTKALSDREKEGARVFANIGCLVCHTGELIGGSMFEKTGVAKPWPNQKDTGRARVTKSKADQMVFKVPSLRNVAKTAPYFHDASAKTLDEAVRKMAVHQLGIELQDDEADAMVAWMQSLTGQLPTAYIAGPTLPPEAVAVAAPARDR